MLEAAAVAGARPWSAAKEWPSPLSLACGCVIDRLYDDRRSGRLFPDSEAPLNKEHNKYFFSFKAFANLDEIIVYTRYAMAY